MKFSIGLAMIFSTLVSAGPVIRRAKGTQCAVESAPAASSSADNGNHHSYVPHNGGGWGHHGGHHQSSWSWSWGSEPSSTGSEGQPEPTSSQEPSSTVDVPATSASESVPAPSQEPSSSEAEPTSTESASSSEAEPTSSEPASSSEAEPTSTEPASSSEAEPTSTKEPETSSTKTEEPSSTPSPTSGSGSGNDSEIDEYLTGHNDFRAKHGADPLTWSDELASKAQEWADKCVFEHSGGSLGSYGENLAAGTGDYAISSGIEAWTSESSDYDPSNPQYSHFTQVVWKSTTELGCAYQMCDGIFDASYGKAKFIVCEYNPAGNVIGEFDDNVQA